MLEVLLVHEVQQAIPVLLGRLAHEVLKVRKVQWAIPVRLVLMDRVCQQAALSTKSSLRRHLQLIMLLLGELPLVAQVAVLPVRKVLPVKVCRWAVQSTKY